MQSKAKQSKRGLDEGAGRSLYHHHHIRLLEVVKRNRQHTVQKIDVGIYMDIHTIHAG